MTKRFGLVASVVIAVALAASSARAEPPESCRTPRDAVASLFGWLAPETYNPTKAARCLDPSGRSPKQLHDTVVKIKAVFEARAVRVDANRAPDEAGWLNPETHRAAYAPDASLPDLVVERQGDGVWRWPRRTLDKVDQLYDASLVGEKHGVVSKLPAWLREKALGIELWQLLVLIAIAICGFALRQLIRLVVKNRLVKFAERHGQQLVGDIVRVFASPGAALLGAGILRVTYPELGLPLAAALVLATIVHLLVLLGVVAALYRLVDVFATHLANRAAITDSKLDDQFVPLVRKSLKGVILAAGVLILLQNLDVNVVSVLAGLGLGGLAVALAAKDSIANFFGSIMIFADRPFVIGDWVKVEDVEGTIEEVGFRSTRIRTLADSVVTIPNARFMEAKIDNFGARRQRRVSATLSLTYDTSHERLEAFVEGLRAVIRAHPKTRQEGHQVHFNAFGPSSLDVMFHCYIEVADWGEELRARHTLFAEILRLAEALGVRFAFPTQTLHVESLAPSGGSLTPTTQASASELAAIVQSFEPQSEEGGGP